MSLRTLPAEIWNAVIDELELDGAQRAIATLSETCKLYHSLLSPILFSKPVLASTKACKRYARMWSVWAHLGPVSVEERTGPVELVLGHSHRGMLPDKPHDIRCRITNCRSALHTTIQHTVVPPYLFGSLGPRAFDALTSLTIGRCDISPNFLAELLSPTSPTRTQLKSLALDIDLDGHPDIEQGMWFVLGLYGLKCLGVSGEMDFEELQEDYPDQDILDFPRGRDGQPIEALKKRAEVDYLALKQLRPWVLNHHCLCPVVMHKHTSYPFDRLTHLEFGIFSEELSPEIPVIFGSNVFHHLKTLCLHGDAYYDAKSSISHFDYVVMLRSVSASPTAKLRCPITKLFPPYEGQTATLANAPTWTTRFELQVLTEDEEYCLPKYQGPELELLDLSGLTLFWDGEW